MDNRILTPSLFKRFVLFVVIGIVAALLTGTVYGAPLSQEPLATSSAGTSGGNDSAVRPDGATKPGATATPAEGGGWGFMAEDTEQPQPVAPTPQATQDSGWGFMTGDDSGGLDQGVVLTPTPPSTPTGNKVGTLILHKYTDQTEQAFTVLVPDGWKTRGGILRVNPLTQDGPGNIIAAKLDFAVTKDDQNSVFIYSVPQILYCDPAKLVTTQLGYNQVGGTYRGMPLYPLPSAQDYLLQMLFPQLHPQASQVQIVEQRSLPELAQKYWQQQQASGIPSTSSYDAGFAIVTYVENGVAYKEKLLTVIHDYGELGVGMWENSETTVTRAPLNEFEMWEPVLLMIQDSVRTNPQWWAMELQGQIQRGEMAYKSQQEINRIAEEIVAHRRETNAEIRNDMYLMMSNQEEYINPYTNEIDIGSNQYQNRWVNSRGDVLYTDDRDYDPNWDPNMKLVKDFKQSQIRPRGPAD